MLSFRGTAQRVDPESRAALHALSKTAWIPGSR